MDPNTVRKIRKIVFNWQFITISILIHLILVTYVGRKTIFKRSGEGSDFTSEDGDGGFVSNDKANEPPAPPRRPSRLLNLK